MKRHVTKTRTEQWISDEQDLDKIQALLEKTKLHLMIENERETELTTKLEQLEIKHQKMAHEFQHIEKEKYQFKARVKSIQQRRSWRYSSPIRKIFSLFKSTKTRSSEQKKATAPKKRKINNRLEITNLKNRFYGLGFTERAFSDIQSIVEDDTNPELKKLAAWELALYYANQYKEEYARKCLDLLPTALKDMDYDSKLLRKAAIEAECYETLGDIDKAKQVVALALEIKPRACLYLLAANLESSEAAKLEWINKALQLYGISKITLNESTAQPAYDRLILDNEPITRKIKRGNNPKVSIIIPAYNAEDVIQTSLRSVLSQTWTNIEVIVVDDCSTDATVEVIEEYVRNDSRVKLIKAESNSGAYVSRNLGLQVATGDFVTCNDADDWSHPEKIEKQVLHLMENPTVIGNYSQAVRATEDLRFFRRSKVQIHIFTNTSSLMFRRKPVMASVGYWDSVRFSADSEFIVRITKVFGKESLVELPTGPLSFARQSSSSLTGNKAFGYHGFKMGARKEYTEAYDHFHANTDSLCYKFPQKIRPFPVPDPMLPRRELTSFGRRHFDVIFVSDFRQSDDAINSTVKEIQERKREGFRTGLIQMSLYNLSPDKKVNSRIRELLDGDQIQMLVFGEKISCEVLIVTDCRVLQEWQRFIPDVKADNIRVIINQIPKTNSRNKQPSYDLNRRGTNLQKYFGKSGIWHSYSSSIRKALHAHHAHDLESITLASEDWSYRILEELLKKS